MCFIKDMENVDPCRKSVESNDRREKRKTTEDMEAKDNNTPSKKPRHVYSGFLGVTSAFCLPNIYIIFCPCRVIKNSVNHQFSSFKVKGYPQRKYTNDESDSAGFPHNDGKHDADDRKGKGTKDVNVPPTLKPQGIEITVQAFIPNPVDQTSRISSNILPTPINVSKLEAPIHLSLNYVITLGMGHA
jgi:hypothetical protein